MKKVFYTMVLFTGILLSCESNAGIELNEPEIVNNNSILPTQVDIRYSDGETETFKYTYSDMKLVKEESTDGYYLDYIYENDQLTEINYYEAPYPDILESYTYDAEGRVATISTNIVGTGVYDYRLSYASNNAVISTSDSADITDISSVNTIQNGNIATFNEGDVYLSTYTYDDKNAPFKNIDHRGILMTIISENNYNINFTLNNLLTEDILEIETSTNHRYVYSYTYTDYDFPRVITENDEDDITTYTITYNND